LFFGLARSCQSWPRFPFLVHAVEQVACFELPADLSGLLHWQT
jgi:hypothetical protein